MTAQAWQAISEFESMERGVQKISFGGADKCDISDDEPSTSAGSEDERGFCTPSTMSPAESNVEPLFDLTPHNDMCSKLPTWITACPGLELQVTGVGISAPPGFTRLPWHHADATEWSPASRPEPPAERPPPPTLPPSPTLSQLQVADTEARRVLAAKSDSSDHEDMPATFDKVAFHRDLSHILRDLVSASNAGAAVQQVRAWRVPRELQAAEFTDLLTRASEEGRGLARRRCFTLAAGLAAGTPSAFKKEECLAGIGAFFKDVYQGLCLEVPRLPAIAANELVPTLAAVLPKKKLRSLLPRGLESALAQGGAK
jgi:hypothetical protein